MNRRRTARNFLSGKDFKKPGVGSAHQKKQPMSETQITTQEANRLEQLESVISKSLGTFIEVGEALLEIRESKLYRETHDTFETYCREKWGMKRAYANHLVRATEAVRALPPEMATIVATESQARELAKVEPERREEVITKATESTGGKLTAAAIKAAAAPAPEPQSEEEEEPEVEVIPPTPAPRYVPSNGMQYARIAINQLEKIDIKDKERTAALQLVQRWVAERL